MTILITLVSVDPQELWRIVIVDDDREVHHDSATSKFSALRNAGKWLLGRADED